MSVQRARTMLSMKDSFRVMCRIEKDYLASGKTDAEFAVLLREELQIPELNEGHVFNRRKELGIPAFQTADQGELSLQTLVSLEKRIAAIEAHLQIKGN